MIKTLFLDIGGVLLTNGWDHNSRKKACEVFDLDFEETEKKHKLIFEAYETGKITLEKYIEFVYLDKNDTVSVYDFENFMFEESIAYQNMLKLILALKEKYKLKICALSNEGRELNEHRIRRFQLNHIFDFYVSSCYVKIRKADPDMYHLALDLSQTPLENTLYIDDRLVFIEFARSLGFPSLHHKDYETTKAELEKLSLRI